MSKSFHWHETDEIAKELAERHPEEDPNEITLADLQQLVEELDGFEERYGHPCNEEILDTIQALWVREYETGLDVRDAYPEPEDEGR